MLTQLPCSYPCHSKAAFLSFPASSQIIGVSFLVILRLPFGSLKSHARTPGPFLSHALYCTLFVTILLLAYETFLMNSRREGHVNTSFSAHTNEFSFCYRINLFIAHTIVLAKKWLELYVMHAAYYIEKLRHVYDLACPGMNLMRGCVHLYTKTVCVHVRVATHIRSC